MLCKECMLERRGLHNDPQCTASVKKVGGGGLRDEALHRSWACINLQGEL